MPLILSYFGIMLSLLILDGIWLGLIAGKFFKHFLGPLLAENFITSAFVIFYLLYPLGILYFAINPAQDLTKAILNGVLLGGLCYATYDLTNWGTLKNWPWQIMGVDILWGAIMTGLCAGVGYWILYKF